MYKKTILSLGLLGFCFNLFAQKDTTNQLVINKKALNFIAMGDWGRKGANNQKEVAVQMGKTGEAIDAQFYMILGDNFYESGVTGIDDKLWKASFEDVYTAPALKKDWFVVLGNHDYKGNPQAEIDYHQVDSRWNMPARYYTRKVAINNDTTQQVLFIFLDTSPLIAEYYSKDDYKNVIGVDTATQIRWLQNVLADPSPNIKWKIVCGHHPLYTGGKRFKAPETYQLNELLKPIFDRYKVDIYVCGHEHNLQYIKPEGATHYFVSGAGSELTDTKVYPKIGKFGLSENGFMAFSVTPLTTTVQIIDYKGKILYKNIIEK